MIITHRHIQVPGARPSNKTPTVAEQNFWKVLGGDDALTHLESPFNYAAPLAIIDEASDSQFDTLLSAFRKGIELPEQGAAIALRGKKFHGHHGRPWVAETGNIHLTAWFTNRLPLIEFQAAMTMLPAVAAQRTIQQLCPNSSPGIKWVNDILIEGKKVSGVITSTQSRGGDTERVLYGIGMNVARAPEAAPTSYVPTTGCLAEHGTADMWQALDVLLSELQRGHRAMISDGPDAIYPDYAAHSLIIGRTVEVLADPGEDEIIAAGRVLGINPDLSLDIEGCATPVRTGRLRLPP
jgi:BirA family biotin operon repressor/biotin-[acetyl-CoA-carboxylase] ligase